MGTQPARKNEDAPSETEPALTPLWGLNPGNQIPSPQACAWGYHLLPAEAGFAPTCKT
jgi:hypothetical protein